MDKDEIIRMARDACAPNQTFNSDEEWVKRFAALVAAHEREACAKVCEERSHRSDDMGAICAAAIRARNNND